MKFSFTIIVVALLAVTVTCTQDMDTIVPEADVVDAPAAPVHAKRAVAVAVKKAKATKPLDAIEVFKRHTKTRIAQLKERKKLAVVQRKRSQAEAHKAQIVTAKIQASNKALRKDMKDSFPVLIREGEKVDYQDLGYGKCITPPELPSIEDASAAFNARESDPSVDKQKKQVVDSVGAIRTMCAGEISSKGSVREKNTKVLVKTQKTEARAKEASSKAETQGMELKTKAEDQEKQSKYTAESAAKATKESTSKTKASQENSNKGSKEASNKSEQSQKTSVAENAAKVSKNAANEKKQKIDDISEAHVKAKKDCEHAEEKKTVVVKSTDTTIEVKGKHEWQHQELTDKAGVEHSHKEMQYKMDEIIKNAAPTQPTITVRPGLEKSMKAQRTTMEASQKQQETSMKEYMHKEGAQKAKETKSKVRANELVLKSNENSMKKSSHDTKPVTNVVVYQNHTVTHPSKEIAAKLVVENHKLWTALEKANKKQVANANHPIVKDHYGGEIKILKEEVKELEIKLSKTPAPTPMPVAPVQKICHKENKSKHPFQSLEKNVKSIMSLKEGVEKSKQKCADQSKAAEKDAKGSVEVKVKKLTKETQAKKEASYAQLEKAQKVLVAAKMTAKDKEHEICDKSRISSEMSNKHQTSFWLGLVKELKVKTDQKPVNTDAEAWKFKLCAAVHEDIGMVSGVDRAALLE